MLVQSSCAMHEALSLHLSSATGPDFVSASWYGYAWPATTLETLQQKWTLELSSL